MGTKRIGVALSDDAGSIAFPHTTLKTSPDTYEHIEKIIITEGVTNVIIGDSRDRKNAQNSVAQHAEELGARLTDAGYSVSYEWEGYSSAHARRLHSFSEGTPRGIVSRSRTKTRVPQQVDASAATLILQSYLDSNR